MFRLLLIVLFLPSLAKAQNCKSIFNSITGKTNKHGIVKLSDGLLPAIVVLRVNDVFSFNIIGSLTVKEKLNTDSLFLLVKFEKGETIKVPSTGLSHHANNGEGAFTFISAGLNDYARYFQTNYIASIEIYPNSTSVPLKLYLSPLVARNILETINCVHN